MSPIDLEKYKSSWNKESAFEEKLLSAQDVLKFMQASSKQLMSLFKKGLVFDIILKSLLFVVALLFIVLLSDQANVMYFSLLIQAFILILIGMQFSTLKKLPITTYEPESALQQLNRYITFYYSHYIQSILNSALSSVFLFIIGSLYYLHFKYGIIPELQIDDIIVLFLFIIIGFGLSFYAQLMQTKFHINQLKACVKDIETDALSEATVKTFRKHKLRNMLLIGILFIVGLLVFLYLIYQFQN